jgi:hypothetical protein
MKHNLVKIHLVLHIANDILNHGVPQNFNSSFTELAHIPIAKATRRTPRKDLDHSHDRLLNATLKMLLSTWHGCTVQVVKLLITTTMRMKHKVVVEVATTQSASTMKTEKSAVSGIDRAFLQPHTMLH